LESQEILLDWKSANASAVFKKESKKDPGNYRPVSLTSYICKILETIIKEKIVNHLEENKILNKSQHGFRAGMSCLNNLLEFTEYIGKSVDKSGIKRQLKREIRYVLGMIWRTFECKKRYYFKTV